MVRYKSSSCIFWSTGPNIRTYLASITVSVSIISLGIRSDLSELIVRSVHRSKSDTSFHTKRIYSGFLPCIKWSSSSRYSSSFLSQWVTIMKTGIKITACFSIMYRSYEFPRNTGCLCHLFISCLILFYTSRCSFYRITIFSINSGRFHYIFHLCKILRHTSSFYTTISFKERITIN